MTEPATNMLILKPEVRLSRKADLGTKRPSKPRPTSCEAVTVNTRASTSSQATLPTPKITKYI